MTAGLAPLRKHTTGSRCPRHGWCGWVMVTHPEGTWEEGVVRSGHALLERQACAGGPAHASGTILRAAVQHSFPRVPTEPGVPFGPPGDSENVAWYCLVHRGGYQRML